MVLQNIVSCSLGYFTEARKKLTLQLGRQSAIEENTSYRLKLVELFTQNLHVTPSISQLLLQFKIHMTTA